jgi:hypothetical protein
MLQIIVLILVALLPLWVSLWGVRRSGRRYQAHLHQVRQMTFLRVLSPPNHQLGSTVGDISCCYNARSPYIRCTVNPYGPCQTCRDYIPSC